MCPDFMCPDFCYFCYFCYFCLFCCFCPGQAAPATQAEEYWPGRNRFFMKLLIIWNDRQYSFKKRSRCGVGRFFSEASSESLMHTIEETSAIKVACAKCAVCNVWGVLLLLETVRTDPVRLYIIGHYPKSAVCEIAKVSWL